MSADDLCSSLVGWFQNRPDDVLNAIARESNLRLPGMRRDEMVDDATTNEPVRMAAQRLLRWDTRGPEDVFVNGLQPLVYPNDGEFPAQAFNLRTYVADNHNSIFVGTTRPYRTENGALRRWERRITRATWHRFEYEIFAYGGIDVNRALGVSHDYYQQHEIAFAGGIIPEMIRSAREYAGGEIVRIWINTNFDNTLNPPERNPPLSELPDVRRTPTDAEVRNFPGPADTPAPSRSHHGHDELRRRRSVTDDNSLMFPASEGEGVVDPSYNDIPIPFSSVACVKDPNDNNRAYIFCGNRYSIISYEPGTTRDSLFAGPHSLVAFWPSLWKAGFVGGVDAVLPNPNKAEEMYFFSGENYALINIAPGTKNDYVVNGPKKIVNEWPSLKQAHFTKVDAVLPNPSNSDEVYFFRGTHYVLINIKPGSNDDYIVIGPNPIDDYWPSLKKAKFTHIDMCLPHPTNPDEAYFFSGDKYALINVKPGSKDDFIVNGPTSVRTEWPSLRESGFW